MRSIFFLLAWAMLSSCASLSGSDASVAKEQEDKVEAKETPQVYGVNNKELELKLTKLWARVDELEGELIRHKEKIRLLEKGLLTGLAPVELTDPQRAKDAAAASLHGALDPAAPAKDSELTKAGAVATKMPLELPGDGAPKQVELQTVTAEATAATAAVDPKQGQYQEEFAKAEKLFQEKHWGQAIAAFGALNVYPDALTHGHHLYWTGLSWFNLKEYQLAAKHFDEFIQKFPADSLVAKAHLHLAKGDLQMGFVEKAVNRLKNVMRDFPADEAAKMAKWEMNRIEQTL